jgi:anti-anti-sigma regulatory factor
LGVQLAASALEEDSMYLMVFSDVVSIGSVCVKVFGYSDTDRTNTNASYIITGVSTHPEIIIYRNTASYSTNITFTFSAKQVLNP